MLTKEINECSYENCNVDDGKRRFSSSLDKK